VSCLTDHRGGPSDVAEHDLADEEGNGVHLEQRAELDSDRSDEQHHARVVEEEGHGAGGQTEHDEELLHVAFGPDEDANGDPLEDASSREEVAGRKGGNTEEEKGRKRRDEERLRTIGHANINRKACSRSLTLTP